MQKLCPECKVPHEPTKEELDCLDMTSLPEGQVIYKAEGCPKCNNRGYSGRMAISELLTITDEVRPLILEKADSNQLKKVGIAQGMITLKQDATNKVLEGLTSVEELMRVINDDEEDYENN